MKDISLKTYAIIGMIISLISFGLMVASLIAMMTQPPVKQGVSGSFAFWVFGIIVALFSLFFYFLDAIVLVVEACKKIDPVFNIVLSIMLIGAIPMGFFVGCRLGINVYIWNAYYLAIFILEIISLVKHTKKNSENNCVV